MKIIIIRNFQEYLSYVDENQEIRTQRQIYEDQICSELEGKEKHYIKGFSWTENEESEFLIDHQYSNNEEINLRERLVCKKTN